MINANDNSPMVSRILEAIGGEYRWPEYPAFKPRNKPAAHVSEKDLVCYTGHYEFGNNVMLAFVMDRDRLLTLVDGLPDEEFLPEVATRFHSATGMS